MFTTDEADSMKDDLSVFRINPEGSVDFQAASDWWVEVLLKREIENRRNRLRKRDEDCENG